MATPLPLLRLDLDFMPSPVEDQPGLLIRDSFGYSEAILVIPPPVIPCLTFFDGERSLADLKAALYEITGQLDVGELAEKLVSTLSSVGFLHDDVYEAMKQERHQAFEKSPVREPAHAGTAYPEDRDDVQSELSARLQGGGPACGPKLIGIAAPHISPAGGWDTYRSAYSALGPEHADRTFIVLGTSHYGEPNRFGLTRKPYVTPLGQSSPNHALIDELALQPAVHMEDYCHAVEHSVEFQVLFLQHLFGPNVKTVPILCGSFGLSFENGKLPEHDEGVRRFLDALGNLAAREGSKLMWVLGIDMAHMGPRYQDPLPVQAGTGAMLEVAARDQDRISQVNRSDAEGFWDLVRQNGDDLKWCGSSPLYTFLRAVPGAKGSLRAYEQWNIDESSVVSFAALSFEKA